MMCLAELVRLYYEYIHDFMPQIKDVTFEIMNSKADEEVKTLAIEVWCSVCEEEIYLKKRSPEKCKNYTNHVFGELLQLMLTLLNSCELDEEDDGDIWNTSTAAG